MKTIEELYQEMRRCFSQRSGVDANDGCDLAVRLYALAAQVYALYLQADWVTRQAFPQSAEGEYLDRHAQMRGLERKTGTRSEGVVRFVTEEMADVDRIIPAGTVCMTVGLVRFETTSQARLLAGLTEVDVPVKAVEVGSTGNIGPGEIVTMAVAPVGISGCTNPEAILGGSDGESDEELRQRILASYQRLPNGANAAFYEQIALSFDQVAGATAICRPRGIGTVDVVVSAQAGLPGQELLDVLTEAIQKRREIAVDVQVRAPETEGVELRVQVAAKAGWDLEQVKQDVETALRGWFTGHQLGRNVLLAQLGSLIYGCDGVANYAILSPASDLVVAADVLPVLNSLTVEAMA